MPRCTRAAAAITFTLLFLLYSNNVTFYTAGDDNGNGLASFSNARRQCLKIENIVVLMSTVVIFIHCVFDITL